MEKFEKPVSVRTVTRKISRTNWGGHVNEEAVFAVLLEMDDIEYAENDKYILKSKKGNCN